MNSLTYDALLADGPALIALDERAVRTSIDLVSRLTAADLDAPTPCAGWNLRDLLEHLIIQHYGFAAASRGVDTLALWKPSPLSPDPIAEYRAAATHVLSAFALDGVLERDFPLPEIRAGIVIPAPFAISFHFVDYVVHSWDMARTLGLPVEFDDEVIEAALLVAQAVPGGDIRTQPGAAFAPEVILPDGSGLDRVLALLGRSPSWPH
ncbi:TIGR03086 family metal-binding protein [Nocardia sp. NBC_01503]|uniref:TIGR03086 family metal-binding protein n=1 Tax=Nocardia sp. NBC_01503 TaxID=2975997 RepID=UPI002E7B5EEA|nr:TIGR03086 family metal-binding protein [Nocardia sp. NBC_01503]WTL33604.1 TIGR03086 family metal-binding protein [Nocardia sp. NBC_01503]